MPQIAASFCSALIQVRMARRKELSAEGVDPIARFAEEIFFIALVAAADRPAVFGHVRCLKSGAVVEDSRVIAAVEVGVGLDEEMVGEQSATIAEQNAEDIAGVDAIALPGLEPGFQACGEAETKDQKADGHEAGGPG